MSCFYITEQWKKLNITQLAVLSYPNPHVNMLKIIVLVIKILLTNSEQTHTQDYCNNI